MTSVVGLYNGEDVKLGDTVFNKISNDQCAWVITDLDGWWGLPDVDVSDDPKPYTLDGSYLTFGRFLPRTVSLRGKIVPLNGEAVNAVSARSELNRAIAPLVRGRALLDVSEADPKVALVQLAGKPLTSINTTTGSMTFDIILRAVDPLKYSRVMHTNSTTIAGESSGRTYNREYNYTYGGGSSSGTMSAMNIGSYATDAIFTIAGPVTSPRIEHVEQGLSLKFDIVLDVGETLTVNTRTRKVLLGGASRRNTLTPDSRWFSLTPGNNTIRYTGVQHIPARPELPGGTNLFINPSFQGTGASIDFNQNYSTDPRATKIGSLGMTLGWEAQWYGSGGGAGTTSTVLGATDGPEVSPGTRVTSYIRKTWATAPTTNTDTGFDHSKTASSSVPGFPVVASVEYTSSSYIRAESATSKSLYMYAIFRDASGATIGSAVSGASVTSAPGVWTRVSLTFTPPTGAAFVVLSTRVAASAGIWAVGDTLDGTGLLVQRTPNLNQYFDGSTPVRLRQNTLLNPAARDSAGWVVSAGTGGVSVRSVETVGGPTPEDTWIKQTWTTVPTGGNRRITLGAASLSGVVSPGEVVTSSAWVWSSIDRPMNIASDWLQANSTFIGQAVGTWTAVPANTWTRLSVTSTAPALASRISSFAVISDNLGGAIGATKALVEKSSVMLPYFDGDSAGASWEGASNASQSFILDPDITTAWLGTANNSNSVLQGASVWSVFGGRTISSTRWSRTGTKSIRLITGPGGIYTAPGGDQGAMRNGMEAEKTYTVLGTIHLLEPQTGPLFSQVRRIIAYHRAGSSGPYTEIRSEQAPNVAGDHEVRLTFTLPPGTTEAFFRIFGNEAAGNADVWWDDVMLIEGEYFGEYFDGTSPFASWSGTTNASTSVRPFVPEVPETMLQLSYRDAWID